MGLEESKYSAKYRDVPLATMTSSNPKEIQGSRKWSHLRRNILSADEVQIEDEEVDPLFNWISPQISPETIRDEKQKYGGFSIYISNSAYQNLDPKLEDYLNQEDINVYNNLQLHELDSNEILTRLKEEMPTPSNEFDQTRKYNVTIVGNEPVHAINWGEYDQGANILNEESLGIYTRIPKAVMNQQLNFIDFDNSFSNNVELLASSYELLDVIEDVINIEDSCLVMNAEFIETGSNSEAEYLLNGINLNPGSAGDFISSMNPKEGRLTTEVLMESALLNIDNDLSDLISLNQVRKDLKMREEYFIPDFNLFDLSQEKSEYIRRGRNLSQN